MSRNSWTKLLTCVNDISQRSSCTVVAQAERSRSHAPWWKRSGPPPRALRRRAWSARAAWSSSVLSCCVRQGGLPAADQAVQYRHGGTGSEETGEGRLREGALGGVGEDADADGDGHGRAMLAWCRTTASAGPRTGAYVSRGFSGSEEVAGDAAGRSWPLVKRGQALSAACSSATSARSRSPPADPTCRRTPSPLTDRPTGCRRSGVTAEPVSRVRSIAATRVPDHHLDAAGGGDHARTGCSPRTDRSPPVRVRPPGSTCART